MQMYLNTSPHSFSLPIAYLLDKQQFHCSTNKLYLNNADQEMGARTIVALGEDKRSPLLWTQSPEKSLRSRVGPMTCPRPGVGRQLFVSSMQKYHAHPTRT